MPKLKQADSADMIKTQQQKNQGIYLLPFSLLHFFWDVIFVDIFILPYSKNVSAEFKVIITNQYEKIPRWPTGGPYP